MRLDKWSKSVANAVSTKVGYQVMFADDACKLLWRELSSRGRVQAVEPFLQCHCRYPANQDENQGKIILITGGAGGVATSAIIEFAKHVLSLTVIAPGSREESINYVKKRCADHVTRNSRSN